MAGELRNWAVMSVVGVIWLTLVVVGAVGRDIHQLSTIADVVPILLILAGVFERWGWRVRLLHPYIVQTPVVRGTWRGELESMWIDPNTGVQSPRKPVYIAVEQSLTESKMRMMTDESSSDQLVGQVQKRSNGRFVLSAIYQNTPTIDRRETSRPHLGAVMLEIYGRPPQRLDGEYWTERQSKGRLEFVGHSSKLADSYREAAAMEFTSAAR